PPDYRTALQGSVKGLRVGLIRHFYERDNVANTATQQAITQAAKVVENLGCIVREITLSPLADWAACGSVILNADLRHPRGEPAHSLHRLRRDLPCTTG